MAKEEDGRHSYDDLAHKMSDYARVKGEREGAQKLVESAKSTMASHQRDVDRFDEQLSRIKAEIKRMLGNLKE